MVASLAASVHASVTDEGHEFDGRFALLPFVVDWFVAAAFVPAASL